MKSKARKSLLIAFSAFALAFGAIGCDNPNPAGSSAAPGDNSSQPADESSQQSNESSQQGGNSSQQTNNSSQQGQSQSQGGNSQNSSSSQQQSSSQQGGSSEHTPVKGDENWIDYANNGSVKLELDYVGKDFYVDGVGQFSLKTAIDGDTAHFTPAVDSLNKGTMKARFYGIDTPESTGKVQEYGKDASDFTKEMLKKADENGTIVVSSAQDGYGAPNPDSTGSRYVSLVWINLTKKNASKDELVLLNLMVVQEGLSWVKNVQSMPQYSDTFYAAERQAEIYKLKLHSGIPDPRINWGDYEDTSLIDMKNEVAACLSDPTRENAFDNAKVRIQGTVCGFVNHILYLQDYVLYDKDDPSKGGEYVGINIFVGMQDISTKYTKLNTYLQVCGLAQYTDNYGFQITDTQGRYPVGSPTSDNDAQIIFTPAQNEETEHNLVVRDYTLDQLNKIASAKDPYNLETLNCRTRLVDANGEPLKLKCNRVFVNSSSSQEVTLYFQGASFNCYIPFNYKGDPSRPRYRWVLEEDYKDQEFTLVGTYVFHKTTSGKISFQIVPNGQNDLVWCPQQA